MPNEEISNIFTQNLKKLLEENNMAAKDLAEKLEVRASTVSMWLTGKNSPRMDLLDKIADLFNIPVSILLTGKSNIAERGLELAKQIRQDTAEYQAELETTLLDNFHCLNVKGQEKALEQVNLLTKIPEYQKRNK